MTDKQIKSLTSLIEENSFGEIPGRFVALARLKDGSLVLRAPGWKLVISEDNEPVRMMLISLCCDLGKMMKSGEYADQVAQEVHYKALDAEVSA